MVAFLETRQGQSQLPGACPGAHLKNLGTRAFVEQVLAAFDLMFHLQLLVQMRVVRVCIEQQHFCRGKQWPHSMQSRLPGLLSGE